MDGVSVGMVHGYGTFSRYMIDKVHRLVYGKLVDRCIRRMLLTFPEVDVIGFGHTHMPCNVQLEGKLLFNPGSTSYPWPRDDMATSGLLHLEMGKEPQGEINKLIK